MPSNEEGIVSRRITYSTLSTIFVAFLAVFSRYQKLRGNSINLSPFEFLQLALAAYRMGRMVSYDVVFETYRLPFAETVPDPTGAGMTVMARGTGFRQAIGELICCPICSGTWITAALLYGLQILPGFTRNLVMIMSAMGAAEFINAISEGMEWSGQAARWRAGAVNRARWEKLEGGEVTHDC